MRILTLGAKASINRALGERTGFDVWALTPDAVQSTGERPYRTLPYRIGSKLSLGSIRQVRDALRSTQPEVIHAFYPRPLAHAVLACASLQCNVPIVSYRGITSLPNRWHPDQWITYLSRRVAAHACESGAVRDALVAAGVPAERCHVVHNCLVDLPAPASRAAARRGLQLADDDFVVLMVANMRRVKGADILLQAARRLHDLPRLRVVLVGRAIDPQVTELAADPQLDGIVRLCGYRADASQLFAAADLFVMPSRAEALCMALIEAMAAGVCPVVSDAGGMKEAVRHGTDGLVFPSENVPALSQALRQLHDDPQRIAAMARSAQQRARSHFSVEAMADRMAAIYGPLAAAG